MKSVSVPSRWAKAGVLLAFAVVVSVVVPVVAHAATYDPNAVPSKELASFTYDGTVYPMTPQGCAFDAAGNMYISDGAHACIVIFDPSGNFLDVWGSSFHPGQVQLYNPQGLTFDKNGYLYVADYWDSDVAKVDTNGVEVGFFTDPSGAGQRPYTCCGNDLAVDGNGILWVASEDGVIERFDPADYMSSIDESWGGAWASGFSSWDALYGIALDSNGDVYVADHAAGAVYKYLAATASRDLTWADNGVARSGWSDGTNPSYAGPMQIRFDGDGNLLVVDSSSGTIVVLDANGNYVTHWPQNPDTSGPISPWLNTPFGLAVRDGKVMVADYGNGRVLVYDNDKEAPVTSVVSATEGWATSAGFTLAASDHGSGVAGIYYTIDGGATKTYTGPVSIAVGGVYEISYWAEDNAGNAETPKSLTLMVDRTAPVTTASTTLTFDGVATIDLDATDSESGVASTRYAVLDGTHRVWTTGSTIVCDKPGTYTVLFHSTDNAGNDEPVQTLVFTLRASGYFSLSGPDTVVHGGTVTLYPDMSMGAGVGTHDVTIQKSADGAAWTDCGTCAAPFSRSGVGFSIAQSDPTYYRAVFAGDADHSPATSSVIRVGVTPAATSLSIGSSASSVRSGRAFTVRGTLSPADPGNAVSVYVKKPGSRRYVRLTTQAVSSDGAWTFRYAPRTRGTYYFYARFAGSATHLASQSRTIGVRVR